MDTVYQKQLSFESIFSKQVTADFDSDTSVEEISAHGFIAAGTPCKGDFDKDIDADGSDLATCATDFGRTDCLQQRELTCRRRQSW